MKKVFQLIGLLLLSSAAFAQIGFNKKKEDIEKFRETRLIVVLFADSAYNASIQQAVEKFWTFSGGVEFVYDTAMKPYNKPEYSYLIFSKGKGSKIKAKVGSSEADFNGLVISSGGKFKKRIVPESMVAGAYCGNNIDTLDWLPELTLAVQMLNTYLNSAVDAENDKMMSNSYLIQNAPTDASLLDRRLLVPYKFLEMKGKEDANTIFDGEIEELDIEDIYKAILKREDAIIYRYIKSEKNCTKLIVSTSGELVYLADDSADKCTLTSKELKTLKAKKDKANKG